MSKAVCNCFVFCGKGGLICGVWGRKACAGRPAGCPDISRYYCWGQWWGWKRVIIDWFFWHPGARAGSTLTVCVGCLAAALRDFRDDKVGRSAYGYYRPRSIALLSGFQQ
ncbi:hypothetical protein [uncultured Roseibium sp.]|uniref:hypothetical protein n=1 Tax=uncultured Roseibium sp. TaxID=1936171 RepID=UPI0026158CFE|nr:hypothetical protein [uncultured Roseibium sp.]